MVLQHRVGWDPEFVRRSPSFWPLARAASSLRRLRDWPSHDALDAMYARCVAAGADGALRLSFGPDLPKRRRGARAPIALEALYDGRITLRREVPTRERDWHDLFNALCFATFPRAKLALHARQLRALRQRLGTHPTGLPPHRTPEQDALTLFDEGGAVIAAQPQALRRLQRAEPLARESVLAACVAEHRARVVPFGHALFEHLVEGLPCPGGATRLLRVESVATSDAHLLAEVDTVLANELEDPGRFLHPSEGAHVRLRALGL